MTYKDLSILKYQQIVGAIELNPDNEIAQAYNHLSIITGVDVEEYKAMKFTDFQKECKAIEFLNNSALPDKFVAEFECQGEKFTIVQHATDWTTEQFISMSTLTKDPKEIINNLHNIMAVLTKGCDSLTEYTRRSELFQTHLSIEVAYPTGFFFAAFLAKLSVTTPYSLHIKNRLKKLLKKEKNGKQPNGIQKNGIGLSRLIFWRKKIGVNMIII